ncbi:MAG: hypothetical protein ACK417_02805 [Bacteroidia bacterium]
MKKFVLCMGMLLGFAMISEAQIQKGNYMLGGNLDILTNGGTRSLLELDAAYFFTDRLAFGLATFGFLEGPFFVGVQSRYLWPVLENTYVFGQAGVYASDTDLRFSAAPGVMYFLNERVALEGRIGGIGGGGIGLSLIF